MQAVILSAGKGTRLHPHTLNKPKPLLMVCGRPLLERIISNLPREVNEVIVVVGYMGEMIIDAFGDNFDERAMKYVWQHEQKGTAHALLQAKHLLSDSFLLMYGDDLVDQESITRAIKHKCAILAFEHPDPKNFGVITLNINGTLNSIVEKPENPKTNLVSAAGIVLHTDIFDYYGDWPEGKEQYIPVVLDRYAKNNPVYVERLSYWYPINSIDQLERAETALNEKTAAVDAPLALS